MRKAITIIILLCFALCGCRGRPNNSIDNSNNKTAKTITGDKQQPTTPVEITNTPSAAISTSDSLGEEHGLPTDSIAIDSAASKPAKVEAAPIKENLNDVAISVGNERPKAEFVFDPIKTSILAGGICFVFLLIIYFVFRHLHKEINHLRSALYPPKSNTKIIELERKIKNLQDQLNTLHNKQSHSTPQPSTSQTEQGIIRDAKFGVRDSVNVPSTPQRLYFSASKVFENGSRGFDSSKGKNLFISMESKYCLTINSDQVTAQVDLVADNFADMLNMPHDYIEPICQSQGHITSSTRRVVCLQAGQARLIAGNWIVAQKMIVRYE